MLRIIMALTVALIASGCSEFMVIAKSAVREAGGDVVNVERAAYRPVPAAEPEKAPVVQPPPTRVAKATGKKGLWEKQ